MSNFKKNYELKFNWVKAEKIDKVGLVTLNHENSLNPLSAGFVEAIYLSCKKFDEDKDINCIVLTGSNKAFAAGADAVMIGSLFSGTDETPGKLIKKNGKDISR